MSWIEKIKNIPLEIITPDGKTYTPIFNTASDSLPMNESLFEFNEVEGGLVTRGPIGIRQYNVELHFVGENNIDVVDEFLNSLKDRRSLILKHPYYDEVVVQPSTINVNRSFLNDIVITTKLYETISDILPAEEVDIQADVLDSIEKTVDSAVDNNTSTQGLTTQTLIEKFKDAANTELDLENVINFGNEALNQLDDAAAYMRSMADLIRSPAQFYETVQNRINTLEEAYTDLKTALTITSSTDEKNFFENNAAIVLTAIAEASVITSSEISEEQDQADIGNDFKTRTSVIKVIDKQVELLNDYLNTIGEATDDLYLPNNDVVRELNNTMAKATGQLFIFAQNALQQRNYVVPEDMTVVTLHHRLYGNVNAVEIFDFVNYNELSTDELLLIKKGREVIYFI